MCQHQCLGVTFLLAIFQSSDFHQAAETCDWNEVVDSEIKSHLIQAMLDSKVKRKALSQVMTLTQVLADVRSNELTKLQNQNIERDCVQPSPKPAAVVNQMVFKDSRPEQRCFSCSGT